MRNHGIEVGMTLNFGPELKFKRLAWADDGKRLGDMKPPIELDVAE